MRNENRWSYDRDRSESGGRRDSEYDDRGEDWGERERDRGPGGYGGQQHGPGGYGPGAGGYGRSAPGQSDFGYADAGSQGGYSGSSYGGSGYGAGGYGGSQYAGYGSQGWSGWPGGGSRQPGSPWGGGSHWGGSQYDRSPSASDYGGPARQYGTGGMNHPRGSDRGEGRYAGRGPKGYRRDDNRIWEDVSEELTQHSEIDAFDITVEVKNGEVTLSGTVPDRLSKRLAEEVAERCSGVKDVQNQLRIGRPSEAPDPRTSGPGSKTGGSSP